MASLSERYVLNALREHTDLQVSRECAPEIQRWLSAHIELLARHATRVAIRNGRSRISLPDIIIAETNVHSDVRRNPI